MKALLTLLTLLAGSIVVAQSTVTINTTGNRNKQIIVDGKNYTIDNTTALDTQAVVISDLAAGQHTMELVRSSFNNNRNASTKTTFTLRDGYDLTLTVSGNGSISSAEKRTGRGGNAAGGQLSATAFNTLYTQIKNKPSSAARATALESEFTTSNRKITSKQASQLIQLISSESSRLKLAKQSYLKISDQQNFSTVTSLLSSTANRTELNAYIASLTDTNISETGTAVNAPVSLTDAQFQVTYNEVIAEPTTTDRAYYLTNFFSRDFNYYTTAQAKKLAELVSTEQDRLIILKGAYRGVTDRHNYSTIYSLLTSSSNRSELAAYVKTFDNANPRLAITTSAFDKLYQSVYSQNSSSARNTALNKTFTSGENYFTVTQAKKLIPLVSDPASRLQLAKSAYKVLTDQSNYTQFNEFLSTTALRNDFNNYVINYENASSGNDNAMNETDYMKLYNSVNTSWSTSSKTTMLAEAFRSTTNFFTTYQVRQLLSLIGTENDKLVLAKSAYDNITDPANYSQLYDLFSQTSNKNDLAAFATTVQAGGSATVKVPLTDTEFNAMYRKLQLTFGIGAKYSSLTEIFNTETNYFTVTQVRQLIPLVSTESNRLELAKLSYNNITDPANFSQLYDVFSSEAAKNALKAYVESSAYNK